MATKEKHIKEIKEQIKNALDSIKDKNRIAVHTTFAFSNYIRAIKKARRNIKLVYSFKGSHILKDKKGEHGIYIFTYNHIFYCVPVLDSNYYLPKKGEMKLHEELIEKLVSIDENLEKLYKEYKEYKKQFGKPATKERTGTKGEKLKEVFVLDVGEGIAHKEVGQDGLTGMDYRLYQLKKGRLGKTLSKWPKKEYAQIVERPIAARIKIKYENIEVTRSAMGPTIELPSDMRNVLLIVGKRKKPKKGKWWVYTLEIPDTSKREGIDFNNEGSAFLIRDSRTWEKCVRNNYDFILKAIHFVDNGRKEYDRRTRTTMDRVENLIELMKEKGKGGILVDYDTKHKIEIGHPGLSFFEKARYAFYTVDMDDMDMKTLVKLIPKQGGDEEGMQRIGKDNTVSTPKLSKIPLILAVKGLKELGITHPNYENTKEIWVLLKKNFRKKGIELGKYSWFEYAMPEKETSNRGKINIEEIKTQLGDKVEWDLLHWLGD